MVRSRDELSSRFHALCEHVYFQPPGGDKLVYPCIIYALDGLNTKGADNTDYSMYIEYSVTYITRDPDDNIIFELEHLPMCSLTRAFTSDNLHHYVYRLFY